jgi:hypothetical protein
MTASGGGGHHDAGPSGTGKTRIGLGLDSRPVNGLPEGAVGRFLFISHTGVNTLPCGRLYCIAFPRKNH